MDTLVNFLNSHASVRSFTKAEISNEQEQLIVTTAQRSPTSSNLQAYSIISVRDSKKKKMLAELSGGQAHVAQSSLFLVFCADLHRLNLLCSDRGYSFGGDHTELFIIATVDATLVAGRALMTAQALGFGGVMVGGIRNNLQDVSDLLNLPDYVYPVMGMSLGKPTTTPKIKPRLPSQAIWFKEAYNQTQVDPAIEEYDQTIDKIGYLKKSIVAKDKFPDFTGLYSWSEHTARRVSGVMPSSLRPGILPFLQSKGFLKK